VGFFCVQGDAYMLLFLLLLQLGSTAIGLRTKDGVVLAVEKRVTSPLLVLTKLLTLPFKLVIVNSCIAENSGCSVGKHLLAD